MKNTFALLAAASATFGVGVDATTAPINLGSGFCSATTYNTPASTDNKCTPQQEQGFQWNNVKNGPMPSYGGMQFQGWTCQNNLVKRGKIQGRNFAAAPGSKVISGNCGPVRQNCPSISTGQNMKGFSVDKMMVAPAYDCRLEAHYEMPSGNICKQSHDCKSAGTVIQNTQCGGAKKVSIVYPKQVNKPPSCNVNIHEITYNCKPAQPVYTQKCIQPPKTTKIIRSTNVYTSPARSTYVYTSPAQSTNVYTSPAQSSYVYTSSAPQSSNVYTSSAPQSSIVYTSSAPQSSYVYSMSSAQSSDVYTSSVPQSTDVYTSSAPQSTNVYTSSAPQSTNVYTSSAPQSTYVYTSSAPQSTNVYTSSAPQSTYVYTSADSSSVPVYNTSSVPVYTSTPVDTSSMVTYEQSTIYKTQVTTIYGCDTSVTNCPAKSTVYTWVTPASSQAVYTSMPVYSQSIQTMASQSSWAPAPQPTGPMPCPDVVPQCLNTFLYMKKECTSNSDAKCYCPSQDFVKNVYSCLYAHGQSDQVVNQAVAFFQGICAPYIKQNDVIVKGADQVKKCITVTSPPQFTAAPATTYVYSGGVVTAPAIVMPTAQPVTPANPASPDTPANPASPDTPETPATPSMDSGNSGNDNSSPSMGYAPIGTGAQPTATNPPNTPVVAGAARMGYGLGLAAVIAAVAAF